MNHSRQPFILTITFTAALIALILITEPLYIESKIILPTIPLRPLRSLQ